MDEKPLIVALADEEELRRFYQDAAAVAGISCRAFRHAEEVPADLRGARMVILNSRALPYASVFSGARILMTGGDVVGGYQDYCVNEVWQNPVSLSVLQGLMRKCTSDEVRVLVVEDDLGVGKYVQSVLNEMKHHVELFSNADEAAPYIPSVHYVLSDITQPKGMGGYGLLKAARRIYDGRQLPFVLMSGCNVNPELMPPDVQAFLRKPFRGSELEAVVSGVLSQRIPKV